VDAVQLVSYGRPSTLHRPFSSESLHTSSIRHNTPTHTTSQIHTPTHHFTASDLATHEQNSTMFTPSFVPVSGLKVGGKRCKSLSGSSRVRLPKDAVAPAPPSPWSPKAWLPSWGGGSTTTTNTTSSRDRDQDRDVRPEQHLQLHQQPELDDSAHGGRKSAQQKKTDREKKLAQREAERAEKWEKKRVEAERAERRRQQRQKEAERAKKGPTGAGINQGFGFR
jgi:hypothetical protein